MRLAIIPARGGSKRIPRKNIKFFCGKPIIAWSIDAALKSKCFDRVIVSTDDSEIAQVAVKHGAEVPFVRPSSLADDYTGTTPVVAHAIRCLEKQSETIEYACCIYSTAPFIEPVDLQIGFDKLRNSLSDYAFSVTSFAFPIQRALSIKSDGTITMLNKEHLHTRSQDLPQTWHDAGQFYWGTKSAWLNGIDIFDVHSAPVKIPRHRVQDIDTEEDWLRAELMMNALLLSEK